MPDRNALFVLRGSAITAQARLQVSFYGYGDSGLLAVDPTTHDVFVSGWTSVVRVAPTTAPGLALVGPTNVPEEYYVSRRATVYAVFTQPMDQDATAAAFTLHPIGDPGSPYPGRVVWLTDRVLVFVSDAIFRHPGAQLMASLGSGARGADGQPLLSPSPEWSFYSEPLRPSLLYPLNDTFDAPTDTPVVIEFSHAMDKASVEARFRLRTGHPYGLDVDGRIGWLRSDLMVFVPNAPFAEDTSYFLTFEPGVTDEEGRPLEDQSTYPRSFNTAPG